MNTIKIFKNYGGLGVLSVWLFLTNSRVDKLENDLRDCNNSKIDIYRELTKPITSRKEDNNIPLLAIIPEKVTFKNNEDETN